MRNAPSYTCLSRKYVETELDYERYLESVYWQSVYHRMGQQRHRGHLSELYDEYDQAHFAGNRWEPFSTGTARASYRKRSPRAVLTRRLPGAASCHPRPL